MALEITKTADYAVRILMDVAMLTNRRPVAARDISRRQLIPLSMVEKVSLRLAARGFLTTRRGRGGGISRGMSPREIRLADIIEAIDGPIVLNRCVKYPDECPFSNFCAVHEVWAQANRNLNSFLETISLENLVARQKKISASRTGAVNGSKK